MKRPNKSKKFKQQKRTEEENEIKLLESWISFGQPDRGFNTLALDPPSKDSRIGRLPDGSFSRFAGADKFIQFPISKKTKKGLDESGFEEMTDIQRSSLPHSLCGDRDILGAAKTGSGKTLAFVIPVLEKLYRARWGPEDGVGCIIISPTRELAGQTFEVLNSVGKKHGFSAGLLIGGRKDVDMEKERVNRLNILVCTPGRLLQHMDETPDFDCSSLQILVIDEADRILDIGFKKDVNAIVSQLPKADRQTLLFSATQTKSVKDLARLSLKDPEYINVHEEAVTATPNKLQQTVMVVPLDQKLDMLWSFLKAHIQSRILVFLSSCKQVKFVYEAFKKLRPGVPLKCLHGRMKQDTRMVIYEQFCEKQSILFCTDVASRGLDFNKAVDWVVQVDCPEDVASYIHRVGRTARYLSGGRSILFLNPSEAKMVDRLREKKIPIEDIKANTKRLQPVSGLLASLLVKYPNLQQLAQRSFITYLRSIYKQKDKEVFDVNKLPIDEFSASLGLPMTPKIRFLKQKDKGQKVSQTLTIVPESTSDEKENTSEHSKQNLEAVGIEEADLQEEVFLNEKDDVQLGEENITDLEGAVPGTRILKKKKLKINVNRPVGTRVVFDEEGNTLPPLARLADMNAEVDLDKDKVFQRYAEMREKMKVADKEDKALDRQRRKEMRIKKKTKLKRGRDGEDSDASEDNISGSDREEGVNNKKSKIYFDDDDDDDDDDDERKRNTDSIGVGPKPLTLAEQEELALKLLNSMNS